MENDRLDIEVLDMLIEKPHGFFVGAEYYCIYPITFGKMCLLRDIIKSMEIDVTILAKNPYIEVVRLSTQKKDECALYLAYNTIKDKEQLFDAELVNKRAETMKTLDTEDMASLLLVLLTRTDIGQFTKHLGIDKERRRYAKANKAKGKSSSVSFFGKSLYGSLLDYACERYGWTLDYVVWGISYINLQLMLADSVKTVHLTKDEARKGGISTDNIVLSGDDKNNQELIKNMDWR